MAARQLDCTHPLHAPSRVARLRAGGDHTGHNLLSMSKRAGTLARESLGEFVGITRLTRGAIAAIAALPLRPSASYDTDALVALAQGAPMHCCYMPDLKSGEIDDERQLGRVRTMFARMASDG